MSTTHPIAPGSLVMLDRDVEDLSGRGWYSSGFTFEVEEFLPAGDPAQDEIAVDFYYGNAGGGVNNVCVPADAVQQAMSPAQMRARRAPAPQQILDDLNLLGEYDGFSTDESHRDVVSREVYGQTDEGLRFGFRIAITEVWEADL